MKIALKTFAALSLPLSIVFSKDWIDTGAPNPSKPGWEVNNISEDNIEISFELHGYVIETKD